MPSAPSNIPPLVDFPVGQSSVEGRQTRLELKPDGAEAGFVDGGWWPRSRKLERELPALLAALRKRLGIIEAVSYHLGEWETPPRRVTIEGVSVRVAGNRLQREGSIDVIARNRRVTRS